MTSFERAARAHIASRGSAGTRSVYLADLARWLAFCELEKVDLDCPASEEATKFRDQLLGKLGAQSVRRILSALSSMYSAAGDVNPFNGRHLIRPPADEVALTRAFADKEARALIAAAGTLTTEVGRRDSAILWVLYETGLRISSVTTMRRERVHRRDDDTVTALVKVKKKGLVEVVLPVLSVTALDSWLDVAPSSPWVFPSSHDARRAIGTKAINKRLEIYGGLAKVEHPSPHRFRAMFITSALDAGVSLNDVQAAVHHSAPQTTQRYDRGVRGTGVTAAVAAFRAGKEKSGR